MIYIILALYKIRSIGKLTHMDIIERFQEEYIKKGIIDKRHLDALIHAYNVTHECNCEHMKQPDDKDIGTLLPLAREFVTNIKNEIMKLHHS